MPERQIVVIGTSAGGVETLRQLTRRLPGNFRAAVFVVMHVPAEGPSILPEILTRAGPLEASHARDGLEIRPGHIFVAPPDRHLIIEDHHMCLSRRPRENRFRPAIDPLFRSAAQNYGPGTIGVILSGTMDDGVAGLRAVKRAGGLAIIQDPEDAMFSALPRNALDAVDADFVLPVDKIAGVLTELVMNEVAAVPNTSSKVNSAPAQEPAEKPSVFTCPDCRGTLFEVQDGELKQYRCRVGHTYSLGSLAEGQEEEVERALWIAIRSLEESATISDRLAQQARERAQTAIAESFMQRARERKRHAEILKSLVEGQQK